MIIVDLNSDLLYWSHFHFRQSLLSPLGGRCYMVLVEENKPKDIITYALKMGMHAKVSFPYLT